MASKRILKENEKWWKVTEPEELFFYTLYAFKAYWDIMTIPNRTANRINSLTGVDVKGYKLRLQSTELKHFLYSHFHELRQGQRSIHFEDIKKLNDVVSNFSYVSYGNRYNTLLFETRFPNSNIFQLVVDIDDLNKILLGKSFRIKT